LGDGVGRNGGRRSDGGGGDCREAGLRDRKIGGMKGTDAEGKGGKERKGESEGEVMKSGGVEGREVKRKCGDKWMEGGEGKGGGGGKRQDEGGGGEIGAKGMEEVREKG